MQQEIDPTTFSHLYNKGLNDNEIAKILKIRPYDARSIREKLGLLSNEFCIVLITTKIDMIDLGHLFIKGMDDTEIAQKLNVGKNTIDNLRNRLNIPLTYPNNKEMSKITEETTKIIMSQVVYSLLRYNPLNITEKQRILIYKKFDLGYGQYLRRELETALQSLNAHWRFNAPDYLMKNVQKLTELNKLRQREEYKDFIELYNKNLEDGEIANKLCITKQQVRNIRYKLSLSSLQKKYKRANRKMLTKADRIGFFDLYNKGMSDKEIAHELNTEEKFVDIYRTQLNLPNLNTNAYKNTKIIFAEIDSLCFDDLIINTYIDKQKVDKDKQKTDTEEKTHELKMKLEDLENEINEMMEQKRLKVLNKVEKEKNLDKKKLDAINKSIYTLKNELKNELNNGEIGEETEIHKEVCKMLHKIEQKNIERKNIEKKRYDEIGQLYKAGYPDKLIAKKLNIHEDVVSEYRSELKLTCINPLKYKFKTLLELYREWFKELYDEKCTPSMIAYRLGISEDQAIRLYEYFDEFQGIEEDGIEVILDYDEESLFCDGDFLEKFIGRGISRVRDI